MKLEEAKGGQRNFSTLALETEPESMVGEW